MNIDEQFNLIAKEYDSKRQIFIPCFEDFYVNTTDFLAGFYNNPNRILDLGAGTGLLSMYWYKNFPDAEFVLDDIAAEMLEVAKHRFDSLSNIKYITDDYYKTFPDGEFDLIISALSIHHLNDEDKEQLFKQIYKKLPQGGMFVNYDQFCFDNKNFSEYADSRWIDTLGKSSLSKHDIELWKERRKLDKECSVKQEINMLKESGFDNPECVYSFQKFSIIAAIK